VGLKPLDQEEITFADFDLHGNKIPEEKGNHGKNQNAEKCKVKSLYGGNCPWTEFTQRPVGFQNIANNGADDDQGECGDKHDQAWLRIHVLFLPRDVVCLAWVFYCQS